MHSTMEVDHVKGRRPSLPGNQADHEYKSVRKYEPMYMSVGLYSITLMHLHTLIHTLPSTTKYGDYQTHTLKRFAALLFRIMCAHTCLCKALELDACFVFRYVCVRIA